MYYSLKVIKMHVVTADSPPLHHNTHNLVTSLLVITHIDQGKFKKNNNIKIYFVPPSAIHLDPLPPSVYNHHRNCIVSLLTSILFKLNILGGLHVYAKFTMWQFAYVIILNLCIYLIKRYLMLCKINSSKWSKEAKYINKWIINL